MDGRYVLGGITGSFGAGSSDFWLIKLGDESAVEPWQEQTPRQFALDQNYPNPFNSLTRITFDLTARCHVLLRVFDIEGRVVAILSDGVFGVGRHSVPFDAASCSSGLYFCQLRTDYGAETKKMVLLK
jgi:hypothetical protein